MRAAKPLALAVLVGAAMSASIDGHARPPAPRGRPPAVLEAPGPAEREAPTSGSVVVLRGPGSEAVLVRGGWFTMGADEHEVAEAIALCKVEPEGDECEDEAFLNEYPPHPVFLADVWIDRTEVTVARYRSCVRAGRCPEPPYASGGARFDAPELPVALVSWNDAAAFCAWAGGRLPTEAEWERAARGRGEAGRRYPWGKVYNPLLANHGKLAWTELDATDGFLELAPVGSYPDGRTPDGLDNLAGNAEEWVADYYAPTYPKASEVNPRGPDSGDERVVRGGSYVRARPWLRTTARLHDLPSSRRPWRGFRCAQSR